MAKSPSVTFLNSCIHIKHFLKTSSGYRLVIYCNSAYVNIFEFHKSRETEIKILLQSSTYAIEFPFK